MSDEKFKLGLTGGVWDASHPWTDTQFRRLKKLTREWEILWIHVPGEEGVRPNKFFYWYDSERGENISVACERWLQGFSFNSDENFELCRDLQIEFPGLYVDVD